MGGTFRDARAAAAIAVAMLAGAAAPTAAHGAAFAAKASSSPGYQFHNADGVFSFTVRNTGSSVGIGSVRIVRPSGLTVTGCPDAPAGWTADSTASECRYRSAPSTADDLRPGGSGQFQVRARSIAARTDRNGSWVVHVSRAHNLSGLVRAAAESPGLVLRTRTFQLLDLVVADGPVAPGSTCPAPNRTAPAGATRTIVVCGRNRANITLTPTAARSTLTGSYLASRGTFASGPVPPTRSGDALVLGNWNGARITSTPGADFALEAVVGAARNQTSPSLSRSPYEATASGPVARDGDASVAEDGSRDIELSATDGDGDPLTFRVESGPSHGTLDTTTPPATCTAVAPSDCTAQVTYVPDGDYAGPDEFTYVAEDGSSTSAPATMSITVSPVNDPPVNAVPTGPIGALADTDVDIIGLSVADIDAAPGNVRTTLTADHGTLTVDTGVLGGASAMAITGNGTDTVVITGTPSQVANTLAAGVTYRSAADHRGADTLGVLTSDLGNTGAGGPQSDFDTVAIDVTGDNRAPVASDDTVQATEDTAIDITLESSDADGEDQTFTIGDPSHGTLDKTAATSCDAATPRTCTRLVRYTPDGDFAGPDSFTFTSSDGTATSNTATVSVTVAAVNDAPEVDTTDAALAYSQGDGAVAADPGLTVTDVDSAQLSGASVQVTGNYTSPEDQLAFSDQLGITGAFDAVTGTLTLSGTASVADYQTALRAVTYENTSASPSTATRTLSFEATDADGATSPAATRDVTLAVVDADPTAVDDSATVDEDAAATAVDVLANDTDPDGGPKAIASATDPANGTVVLTGGSPGAHTGLTYEPDPDYCNDPPGTAPDTFTYTLNGGSSATVSVTVTCVNDAPVADDETFGGDDSAHGNTTLQVDDPTDDKAAPTSPHKEVTGDILDGDTDVDGPGPLTVTPGTFATNDGGSVTIESDGDFVFEPAASTSCADPSDFFDYTVEDSGTPEQTDTGRVTIAIAGCVWYVSNDHPGNSGTSRAPFDTLQQAETASGANHTVFVFEGDGTSTGLDAGGYLMNAAERLIGEHEGLTVDPDGFGPLTADALHPASPGAFPTLTTTNADVVTLHERNEVRGLVIDPAGTGGGIFGGGGLLGGTIDDVSIVDGGTPATQPALELDNRTGAITVSNFRVDAKSTGVRLAGVQRIGFQGASSVVTLKTDGAPALRATNTDFSGSTIDEIVVTNSPDGGVDLDGTTDTIRLGDGSGTDLDLTTVSGAEPALDLNNAGNVVVDAGGTDELHADGGPAVDVTGTPGAKMSFDEVDSFNSAGDAVNLDGLGTGAFIAEAGTLGGYAGTGFDLHGGSETVRYSGTLADGPGATAIEVTGRTGGIVTFSGAVQDSADPGGGLTLSGNTGGSTVLTGPTKTFNTGASDAVRMTSSDGHLLGLGNGGLDIDTTSGKGLEADASGALTVNGTGNTIDTGTGRALHVSATDIHDDDLRFQRISSDSAVNGIRLNSTGNAAGRLSVDGAGGTCATPDASAPVPANCTGGHIARSTGSGIVLHDVPGRVDLSTVAVTGSGDHGISASGVGDGVRLGSSVIQGNGGDVGVVENGLDYTNVRGVTTILASDLRNNDDFNARIANSSGTLHLTATNSDFFNSAVEDGLQVIADGTATIRSNVAGNRFDDNKGDAIQYGSTGSATGAVTDATIDRNVIDGKTGTSIDGGIVFGGDGAVRGAITNNTVTGVSVSAVIVNPFGTAAGTSFDATVTDNLIGTPGVQQSGSADGDGMQLKSPTDGTAKVVMSRNRIHGWQGTGMRLRASESTNGATTHVTAQSNTIGDDENGASEAAIYLQSGALSADVVNLCADVGGAGGLANTFSTPPVDPVAGIADFVLDLRFVNAKLRLPGYTGTTSADRQAYFLGRNSGFTTFAQDGSQNPSNEADGSCDQPAGPTLPTAP